MDIETLSEITVYALLGLLGTAIWAPLLINLLYKMNFVVSMYWQRIG
jgi:hypothetical protein